MHCILLITLTMLVSIKASAYEMTKPPLHSHSSNFEGQIIDLREQGASSEAIVDHAIAYLESQNEPLSQAVVHDILMALKSPVIIGAFKNAKVGAVSQVVLSKVEALGAVTSTSPNLEALRLSVVQDWQEAGLWKQEGKPVTQKKKRAVASEADALDSNPVHQTL